MIRIIAGTAKGAKLSVPAGLDVRPTGNRVREALFSSLGHMVSNARVLDLFAGTGALGLEAMSRGADSVVFVEKNRATAEILKRNISKLGFEHATKIVFGDAIKTLPSLSANNDTFHLVFLDPPYASNLLERSLASICSLGLLADGGKAVAEHASGVVPKGGGLQIVSTKSYGDTDLTVFEQKEKTSSCR